MHFFEKLHFLSHKIPKKPQVNHRHNPCVTKTFLLLLLLGLMAVPKGKSF
jgi:hypothetical protein